MLRFFEYYFILEGPAIFRALRSFAYFTICKILFRYLKKKVIQKLI